MPQLTQQEALLESPPARTDDVSALIEGFGEGFYAVDREWRVVLFNETATSHFHIRPEQAIGRNLWELFPSAAVRDLGAIFRRAMEAREFLSSETESAIFPGRWLSYRLFPFRDGMGVVFRDITALRDSQIALGRSEQRYRTLVENANDLVVTLDLDFRFTSVNAAVERVLGYEADEIIGTPLRRYVPASQLAIHRTMLERKLAGDPSTAYEMTARDKSGRWRILQTNSRLSFDAGGRPLEIQAIARDVTEQRAAEQAVRASEERFRLAAEAAGLGVFEIDWKSRKRYWSPDLASMLRVPTGSDFYIDKSVLKRVVPEPHLTRFREKLRASTDPASSGTLSDEHPIVRLDGTEAWIHLRGKTFFEEHEGARRPARTIGVVLDITERKRGEETDALLAAVVRSSRDAIISLDKAGQVRTWNRGAERLYGYSSEEIIGSSISVLAPGDLGEEVLGISAQVLTGSEVEVETVRRRKQGSMVPVQISAAPMRSADGAIIGMSAVHRDISERKRHEEHIEFTMRELSHRTKNVLAVVQAIARQIGGRTQSIDQFQDRLSKAVQALAFCHDLLVEEGWRGAALERLVQLQLSGFGASEGARLTTCGPPVILRPHATQLIGLALHELATNAAKYGSLSNASGAVQIRWEDQEDGSVVLVWQENGGPAITAPSRKGFGHTVLSRTATALETQARHDWRPDGLVYSIRIPVQHLLRHQG